MKDTRTLPPPPGAVLGAVIAIALLVVAGVACRSSSSGQKCTGQVEYQGTTYTGEADNLDDAQKFACNKYCLDADPEFDAHYRIWLDSAKGRAAGSPPKKESIYKDKELLDYLTVNCAQKCVAKVKDGSMKGHANCP